MLRSASFATVMLSSPAQQGEGCPASWKCGPGLLTPPNRLTLRQNPLGAPEDGRRVRALRPAAEVADAGGPAVRSAAPAEIHARSGQCEPCAAVSWRGERWGRRGALPARPNRNFDRLDGASGSIPARQADPGATQGGVLCNRRRGLATMVEYPPVADAARGLSRGSRA